MSAVSLGDASAFEVMKPELKRARVSAAMLADVYIPEVARRLGEAWMLDGLTFAEVTMGTARLQAILREIGTNWSADAMGGADGATILVVLPVGEQHTLGAMVLAGRLRRKGISVAMRIAPHATDLAAYVASRNFDAAFVSVAVQDRLETCGKLVRTLKEATGGRLKVAVGGAVLDQGALMAQTGADMVSSDIDAVLQAFGVVTQAARVPATA
jgi:methylmalonyl-CoA mutase cobalamin-binding subunit